jgi:serine phosphatase RsbU (regulator of sigma subunit)
MQHVVGIERRRRPTLLRVASALPMALEPLSEIVQALTPSARLTVLSIDDDALEVVASTGPAALRVGTMLRSPSLPTFRRRLLGEGSLVVHIDDAELPKDTREALRRFGFESVFLAPLQSFGNVTECVVVDEPGQRAEFDGRERRLLTAAVSQARAALENAGLRLQAAKRQRALEAIARLGVVFTAVLDLKQTASQVVEYAALLLEMPASVLLFRPEGAADFVVLAAEGLPREVMDCRVNPLEVASLDVKRPGELATRHLSESAHGSIFELFERVGLVNVLVAPLVVGEDRLRGVLLGLDRRKLEPREEEHDVFHLLAMQATNAIWNAERYEAEVEARRQAKRELETTSMLLEAADALAEVTDLEELFATLARVILASTKHSRLSISTWDPARRELHVVAGAGPLAYPVDTIRPWESLNEATRAALQSRRTVVNDFDALPVPEGEHRRYAASGLHLALHAPIVYRDRLLGLITLDEPGERQEFSDREISIVEGIASQAAVAIEGARLFEASQRHAELERVLAQAAASLASSLDLADVLPDVLSTVSRALGAVGSALARREPTGWRTAALYGLPLDVVGEFHTDAESPTLTTVWHTREPFLVPDVGEAANVNRRQAMRVGYRSFISYPLLYRGEVTAVLTFFYEQPRGPFTEEERDFVARLAFMIAAAEENARLFEAEHGIAETLQEALLTLPDRIPGVSFAHAYHSASAAGRVGGDFYDIFEIEHDRIGVTVGDIAGKGLKAAVLTSLLKNTLRAHTAEADKTPATILHLTNEIVYRATGTEQFATVFFGVLDCRDGRLIYANAGHTTGAILSADGTVRRLPSTGPIVGAFPALRFEQQEVFLRLDDMLFLYTDGLTEARNDGEQFGEDRVFDILATISDVEPRSVIGRVIGESERFTGGVLRDDLALFAVQRLASETETESCQELRV